MKIEWLIINITADMSLVRATSVFFGYFWAIFSFFGQVRPLFRSGSHFVSGNSILGSKKLTSDYLLKMEWLITDVTAIGSPARAEEFFWVILVDFWPI